MHPLAGSPIPRILVRAGSLAVMVHALAADAAGNDDSRDARAMGYQAVDHGWTEPSIIRHARNGDALEFGRALGAGQNVEARDLGGNTPFHWAIYNGHFELAKVILQAGAHVNATNNVGETALHWAARHCPVETVEFLLAKGADPNIKNVHGTTPIQDAERLQRPQVAVILNAKPKHD